MAQSQRKLGRLPRARNPRVPHMSSLLAGRAAAALPPQIDYTSRMPAQLGIMMNDTLGDCTYAAYYHAIQVWTFNAAQNIDTEPDIDVEDLYIQACGYNPKRGGEGPGGNAARSHVLAQHWSSARAEWTEQAPDFGLCRSRSAKPVRRQTGHLRMRSRLHRIQRSR